MGDFALHLSRSVLACKITQNAIIAIDSTPTVYYYSLEAEFQSHLSIGGLETSYHRYSSNIIISSNGHYAVVCDGTNDKIIYIDLMQKMVVATLKMVKSPEFTTFSPDDSCFLVANGVGRIAVYSVSDFSIMAEFALPDSVSSAVFSDDSTLLAVATLDKKLHIFEVSTNSVVYGYQFEDIGEALCFSRDNKELTVFTRNGNSIIINFKMDTMFNETPFYEWPTAITHVLNSNVVLLGTRSSRLFLYTSSKCSLLGTLNLDSWGITSISIQESRVAIGFCDGEMMILDQTLAIQNAYEAIESKNFSELCVIAVNSPLIFVDRSLCDLIEEIYEDLLVYHPKNSEEKAGFDALVALIVSSTTKRQELLSYLVKQKQFVPFLENIDIGQVEIACRQASDYPLLRQLREFHQIKNRCMKHMVEQIRLLESNPQRFHELIESMEQNCSTCIQGIFQAPQELEQGFAQLQISVDNSNYTNLLEIVEKYPIFRKTRIYKKMMHYGERYIEKVIFHMQHSQMSEALEYAQKLTRIKPFEKTGIDFKQQIENHGKFTKALESRNMEQVFSIALQNPVFKTTDIFKEQIVAYKNLYTTLLQIAKQGDVVQVVSALKPYEKVNYFADKNLQLLKLALISEILLYAPIGLEKETLAKYHDCFGYDKEYERVCEEFKTEINYNEKSHELSTEYKVVQSFISGEKKKRT